MELNSILERQDRRTLSISITRDGLVKIKAPLTMPMSEIQNFVNEKQSWIKEKLASIENVIDENKDVIDYRKFLYIGEKYLPYWADVNDFYFDSQKQCVYIPKRMSESVVLPNLYKFYRKRAKSILSQRVKSIADTMNVDFKRIRFSNAKSRWGSCSSAGVISLNWKLILLPTKLIDYVIVHELSHLSHMDHSNKFWKSVETYVPDYGFLRKDLKRYSYVLNMFR